MWATASEASPPLRSRRPTGKVHRRSLSAALPAFTRPASNSPPPFPTPTKYSTVPTKTTATTTAGRHIVVRVMMSSTADLALPYLVKETVFDFKRRVCNALDAAAAAQTATHVIEQLRLLIRGRELIANTLCVEAYDLQEGAILQLVVRPKGLTSAPRKSHSEPSRSKHSASPPSVASQRGWSMSNQIREAARAMTGDDDEADALLRNYAVEQVARRLVAKGIPRALALAASGAADTPSLEAAEVLLESYAASRRRRMDLSAQAHVLTPSSSSSTA